MERYLRFREAGLREPPWDYTGRPAVSIRAAGQRTAPPRAVRRTPGDVEADGAGLTIAPTRMATT